LTRDEIGRMGDEMEDWLKDVKPLTVKGQIAMPYTWSVGETGSSFLVALRDQTKILASRCDACGTVYVPPRKNCPKCFTDIQGSMEVGPEGTVEAFTIVRQGHPLHPAKAPFAYVLVRLDGSDVGFLHIVRDDWDKLAVGCRVKALFRAQRTGHILDIDTFQVI